MSDGPLRRLRGAAPKTELFPANIRSSMRPQMWYGSFKTPARCRYRAAHQHSLSSVLGEKGSLGAAREGVSLCTDKIRPSPARTATRSSRSPRASSSSTLIDSSASRDVAPRAEPPRRQPAETAAAATRAAARAADTQAAATPADRARCSAQRARAAAARPRSPSAQAARSPSTAAIASAASEVRAAARPTSSRSYQEEPDDLGLLLIPPPTRPKAPPCAPRRRMIR